MSNRRRYYLHQRLKGLFRIAAHRRTIHYSEDAFHMMTDIQVRYFVELQLRFKYSAQLEIR